MLEWLRSPNVAKLLASAAEDVATFAKDEEKSAISWKLLRAALRARKITGSGKFIFIFYTISVETKCTNVFPFRAFITSRAY